MKLLVLVIAACAIAGACSLLETATPQQTVSPKTIETDWVFRRVNLDTGFVAEHAEEISELCYRKQGTISFEEKEILCFNGEINAEKVGALADEEFSIAYIRSGGGGNTAAMDLGRLIAKNAAMLIVNEHCHSACANYVVPASRRLYMMDDTVISMHGFPPRHRMRRAMKILRGKGMSPMNTRNFNQLVIDEALKHEEYDETFTLPEVRYFSMLSVDEAYITRFDEIVRTLNNRDNYICGQIKGQLGLNLIVGPKYLKEFRIKTIREWYPEELSTYVELKPKAAETAAYIFDFDDYPFWVPGKGIVTREDCVATNSRSNSNREN